MLTNCLAECAHLTITVSQIERDIGQKSSFFHTPLHLTPPSGGRQMQGDMKWGYEMQGGMTGYSRRNIAIPFRMEKLEWLGYQMVKNFEDIFIRFGALTNVTDRRTDRQRVPAYTALMHSIAL